MQAASWAGPGRVTVAERPVPVPEPGWVRIRVAGAGICGSDLHTYHRGGHPDAIPGHEVGGVVDLAGEGVALDRGTPVAVEPIAACGRCYQCLQGNRWHCLERIFLGGDGAGGMAEYMAAPLDSVYPLPVNVPAEAGSLAEPLGIGIHAVNEAGVRPGQRVAILGAGTVGLTTIMAARRAGASEVYITARHGFQAEMARSLGATAFATSEEALRELTATPIDAVIETVGGDAPTVGEAVRLVRPRGTVVVLGAFGADVPLPAMLLVLKEVRLIGAVCYRRTGPRTEFGLATELLVELLPALEPLVTHTRSLDAVAEAFAIAADKSTGSIKVRLTP